MKKSKILAIALFPMAIGMLASCGDDKGGGDNPDPVVNHEVTADEWAAAFGLSKPYYIADNYKLVGIMSAEGQSSEAELIVDGLKLQANEKEDKEVFTTYNEIVGNKKYEYTQDGETKKWKKEVTSRTVADDFASSLIPFGQNYSSFAFDAASKSYKCASLTYEGQALSNLTIKFNNKQINQAGYTTTQEGHLMNMVFTFTYGGQTVTLPEVEPVVAPVYSYKVNGGESKQLISMEQEGNTYYVSYDALHAGDVFTFYHNDDLIHDLNLAPTDNNFELVDSSRTQVSVICDTPESHSVPNVVLAPMDGGTIVQAFGYHAPIATDTYLMGVDGDWEIGVPMEEVQPGVYETEGMIFAGDAVKIKHNGDYVDWSEVEGDAFSKGVCEVTTDGNANAKFVIDCDVIIKFDNDEATILFRGLVDPYQGVVYTQQGPKSSSFDFNKITATEIEYMLLNVPTSFGKTYEISKNDVAQPVTVEEGGEGSKFTPDGTKIIYSGSAEYLDFYLKENRSTHDLTVYVEEHLTITYDLTIRCESEQSTWAFGDDVDLFVATIDGENQTNWIKVIATDNVVAVTVPNTTVKFLMVRCVKGTETPDWNITSGDEVGRIYNQTTPDTVLVKGPGEYTVHFVDYPMPE